MRGKRGLSAIVTTAIMIGLVLVAVGIVWVVISNIIGGGTEDAEYAAKCTGLDLEIASATCGASCSIVVKRNAGTEDADLGGVSIIISNTLGESQVTKVAGNIAVLASKSMTAAIPTGTLDKAEVVAYFTKTNGDEYICAGSSLFSGTL